MIHYSNLTAHQSVLPSTRTLLDILECIKLDVLDYPNDSSLESGKCVLFILLVNLDITDTRYGRKVHDASKG